MTRGVRAMSRAANYGARLAAMDAEGAAEVVVEDLVALRAAVVNRPRALNAINLPVVDRLHELVTAWDASPHVHGIMLKGAGERAFCAGGDVKTVAGLAQQGDQAAARQFFAHEYRLNHKLGTLSKPLVAVLDGVTMGGGCGLSMHGAFRVATERTLLAMPECPLGLFPDVGASHFLARHCQGNLGAFLGLTGARLGGAETKLAGLATHFVPSHRLPALEERLAYLGELARDPEVVDNALREFEDAAELPGGSPLHHVGVLDECFGKGSVEEIQEALAERLGGQDADEVRTCQAALQGLAKGSPTSLKVTLQLLAGGKHRSLKQSLELDYRLASRFLQGKDFFEGVRAILLDKDNTPQWDPATLSGVDAASVDAYFAPLPASEELRIGADSSGSAAAD